jgi:hypothetical protein
MVDQRIDPESGGSQGEPFQFSLRRFLSATMWIALWGGLLAGKYLAGKPRSMTFPIWDTWLCFVAPSLFFLPIIAIAALFGQSKPLRHGRDGYIERLWEEQTRNLVKRV